MPYKWHFFSNGSKIENIPELGPERYVYFSAPNQAKLPAFKGAQTLSCAPLFSNERVQTMTRNEKRATGNMQLATKKGYVKSLKLEISQPVNPIWGASVKLRL